MLRRNKSNKVHVKKIENPVFGNQVEIKTTIDCNGVIVFIENADIFDLIAPDKL